jgi:hypothetical protein
VQIIVDAWLGWEIDKKKGKPGRKRFEGRIPSLHEDVPLLAFDLLREVWLWCATRRKEQVARDKPRSARGSYKRASHGNVMTAQAVATATAGMAGVVAGTQTASSGYITVQNANGLSFGLAANVMTASVASAAPGVGTGTGTNGMLSIANSNGLSFGLAGVSRTIQQLLLDQHTHRRWLDD